MASLNQVRFQHRQTASDGVQKNRSNTDFSLNPGKIEVSTSLPENSPNSKPNINSTNSVPFSNGNGFNGNSNGNRIRSQTERAHKPHHTHSPRLSARPHSTTNNNSKRTNSERNAVQNMWVHSASNSIFSGMHGMEAMVAPFIRNTTSGGSGPNSPVTSNSLPGSRHNSIHRTNTNGTSESQHSPTSMITLKERSPPMRKRRSSGPFGAVAPGVMSLVMNPMMSFETEEEANNHNNNWEDTIKQWETQGDWVECRETVTGRVLWYNTQSYRMIFDSPPDGVQISSGSQYTKDIGPRQDEFFLNRPIEPYEGEDIVEGLLQFENHPWEFNNELVDYYRARACKRDHSKMLPEAQQYCFPEYFSMSPLPVLPGGRFIARIRLPEEFSAHRRYSSVQIKVDYTTAWDAIKQGVDKLDSPHNEDRKDFILKVVGQEAYMYGKKKIIEYEAVRMAVRNEKDVEFVMIKRPDFKERVEEEKKKQKEYEEHFQSAYPLHITEHTEEYLKYDELSQSGNIEAFSTSSAARGRKRKTEFSPRKVISLYDCEWHYRLKIEGLTNVSSLPRFEEGLMKAVYVVAELWMGDMIFEHATLMTKNAAPSNDIRWGQWRMSRNQTFSQIPRESVLCFMVMAISSDGGRYNSNMASNPNAKNGHQCLAWCRLPLIDHAHKLRSGKYLLNMWEIPVFKPTKDGPKVDPYKDRPFRYRGVTRDKTVKQIEPEQCQLLIEFDQFAFDVVAPKYLPKREYTDSAVGGKLSQSQMTERMNKQINNILKKTPLEQLEIDEKRLIWQARDLLWHDPDALPALLRSVNWTNLSYIAETHKYLSYWTPPKRPEDALEYLDYRFADTRVREKALSWLEELHDSDLNKIMLQLVQCLKYEPHHDSALSRFLLRRGLANPYQIGHYLFWHLKAELHELEYCEKFGVLAEEYLRYAGEHSKQLFTQNVLLKRLEEVAIKIQRAKKSLPDKAQVERLFHRELSRLNRAITNYTEKGHAIQMTVNPRLHATKLVVEKCRFMSSKKVPLWLVFQNADTFASLDIAVMFKAGDDLRQDMLTLQLLRMMDRLWLDSKLDLHLKPYAVLATGDEVGMMELVTNADTVNSINMEFGGAFNETTIDKYLKKHNPYPKTLEKARQNFARSCAGYCVATCVLGIGDRHSDNYMVHQNGQFFHIDFGHFLGNFKSKFKIKRERSPFVFSPQMKYAIDGGTKNNELYKEFLTWCVDAYNVLRARSRLLLVLFTLMVSAGLPELSVESDIAYFQNMLNLSYKAQGASKHIQKEIEKALRDKAR